MGKMGGKTAIFVLENMTGMKNLFHIFSFTLVVCLSACNPKSRISELKDIESYIHERPDSALSVLFSIEDSGASRKEKAYHALLLGMALDKNDIYPESDSLAATANEYYKSHGSIYHRMLSYFYLARLNKMNGDNHKAIFNYGKAMEYADRLNNLRYKGLISYDLGDLQSQNYNDEDAVELFSKASRYFKEAGLEDNAFISTLEMAKSLWCIDKAPESHHLLDSLLMLDYFPVPREYVARNYAQLLYLEINEPDQIIELFEQLPDSSLQAFELSHLALLYEKKGDRHSSERYLKAAQERALDRLDSAKVSYDYYNICKLKGNYPAALKSFEFTVVVQDSILRQKLSESVTASLRDYYQQAAKEKEQKVLEMRGMLIAAGALLLVLIAYLYGSMVKHRKQVKEDMAAIESLELHIRKSPDGYRLKEILLAQVSNLLQLANKYHSEDRRSVKDELFKKFEINLNSLKDDTKVYTLLEDVLNSCHDSVMEHLHKEYPTMKPKTSNVLAMMFLGFRYEDICLLTRTHSKSSLMSFKSRYKDKFKVKPTEHSYQYLNLLEGH
jgi:hypothetical protein